jgi:hypothetical protein
MTGMLAHVEEDLRSERVSGGWTKNRGMEVIPESERPFTPIFDSSNSLSSFLRS